MGCSAGRGVPASASIGAAPGPVRSPEAAPDPATVPAPGSTPRTEVEIEADWADVDAALNAAFRTASVAPLRRVDVDSEPPSNPADAAAIEADVVRPRARVECAVLHMSGAEGVLLIEKLEPEPDPVRMRIACRFGPFGNPDLEARLVSAIRDRLERLRGVDWAGDSGSG